MKRLKRGFTLVELSIVIIIIGFLIAGISGGQALVESARISTFIRDLNSYQQATFNFKERYGYLPGDLPNASSIWPSCGGGSPAACDGNGDGAVNSIVDNRTEDLVVFEQLSLSGFINDHITYDGTLTIDVTVPRSNLRSGAGYWLNHSLVPNTVAPNIRAENQIIIGTNRDFNGQNILNNGAIGPNDASIIDQKIDDGNPFSGFLLGLRAQDRFADTTICNDIGVGDPNNVKYLFSDQSDNTCYLLLSPTRTG